ncbi:MAG: ribose-phosphate diphosphokinase, partial [Pseudomonadota bacterium]|nr:ribose-phosphate diphosphokinase [Pseudomonadota bacterium]
EVKDKECIIVDDIADTAGTLCNAAEALKGQGALKVYAYIVHPVLSGNAIEKISQSKLDQLVVTDTIPLSEEARDCEKIRIISMAPTLAEAIRRVNNEESISAMFL